MIQLIREGVYKLGETKGQTKILTLDEENVYAWVNAARIGEILISSNKPHEINNILTIGKYRLYKVKDDLKLTDLEHLELFVGDGSWQGYLLTTGLPDSENKRKRIIPTNELITKTVVQAGGDSHVH